MDTLPCLPNPLVQFPVLISKTEPPRENAEARLDGRVLFLSHSNLDSGDGVLCFEIVSHPWATGHTAQLRRQWKA